MLKLSATKLYSYVVKEDHELAPSPFHGYLTLNVCKPNIRLLANIGDWVLGFGSKNVSLPSQKLKNLSGHLVYAMKITDKITMQDYDLRTHQIKSEINKKIPNPLNKKWPNIVGDSLYNFDYKPAALREGLYCSDDKEKDLRGEFTLISENFFLFW